MVPLSAIAEALRNDEVVFSLAAGGVFDYDVRRFKGEVPMHPNGLEILPYVIVDDLGGGPDGFAGHSSVFSDRVAVWVFAPRSAIGQGLVIAMIQRVQEVLQGWQEPISGTRLAVAERIGLRATDAPDNAFMDRVTFRVSGVLAGGAW